MSMSSGALRRLDVISALLLVAALAVYVWPISVGSRGQSQVRVAAVSIPSPVAADTSDAQTVIVANLLSASRRAPLRRYVSPDIAAATEFSMPPAFAPASGSSASDAANDNSANDGDDEAVPALYGIVSVSGSPRALLRLSPGDANPSLFGEGDTRGAYRVISIHSSSVVLAGPSGSRTLSLARPARGDSIGKTP